MKLVVIIPAYNEEKTIASVIAEIPRHIDGLEPVEILLIDDGSTDSTIEKAREAGVSDIISHERNEGLGVAFRDGLETALEMGADIIVNIDGDGQYNALEIAALVRPVLENKADIVIGWRDIDSLDFMPKGKKLGNKIATRLTSMVSGISIRDAQSGYRAFSREAALRMNLSGKYTYVQETIIEAKYKGLKIEQMPIEFRPRQGESRLIPNLSTYARRAGAIILGTYWKYNPLKIFSLIGMLFILVGVILGSITLFYLGRDGTISGHTLIAFSSVILLVIGLQAIVLGLFANTTKSQRLFHEEILYRLKSKGSNARK